MGKSVYILADIGGTNVRFAYVTADGDKLQEIATYRCIDFVSFEAALRFYTAKLHNPVIVKMCLAIAAKIDSDTVSLLNNHWLISRQELQHSFNTTVMMINDFTAQVLSIDRLQNSDLHWLGKPPLLESSSQHSPVKAVLGPGTGLGVSAMLSSGYIVASEGGHIGFAPVNDHEIALLNVLLQRYQRVSVERLLSGQGLENIYWANNQLQGVDSELSASEVTEGAKAGDTICQQTVSDFFAVLGSVAGDVALMMGAERVYLTGGIMPRLLSLLDENQFRQRFAAKGRYSEVCSRLPVAVILAEHPGLLGCLQAIRQS